MADDPLAGPSNSRGLFPTGLRGAGGRYRSARYPARWPRRADIHPPHSDPAADVGASLSAGNPADDDGLHAHYHRAVTAAPGVGVDPDSAQSNPDRIGAVP